MVCAMPTEGRCEVVLLGRRGRKGPIFIEIPLDVQGASVSDSLLTKAPANPAAVETLGALEAMRVAEVAERVRQAKRPVVLIGGGILRETAAKLRARLLDTRVAFMTTYNGADRLDARDRNYFGRPNTWGQRYANVLFQQADLVIALGTRLGLQQTGFNWQEFAKLAFVVQVEIDPLELEKGHPHVDLPIHGDANTFLDALLTHDLGEHEDWLTFARTVCEDLPLSERANEHREDFVDPYDFYLALSEVSKSTDIFLPCSSGGTFTVGYQAIRQRFGQLVISNKSLASMGYGLSGAIGAALAHPTRRVLQCEGDGGFTQNAQELATLRANALDVKLFIMSNEGYGSIRMTQKTYFGGAYLGCDTKTGLGFPEWDLLFKAYGIPSLALDHSGLETPGFRDLFETRGPAAFVIPIDPNQTYFPKITSRIIENGSMESNPLHLLSPELPNDVGRRVMPYLEPSALGIFV